MAYYEEDELQRFSDVGKHRPDLFEKFMAWYQACQEDGALTRREKALIGLAVAHVLQCPYCIDAYSQACLEAGSNMTVRLCRTMTRIPKERALRTRYLNDGFNSGAPPVMSRSRKRNRWRTLKTCSTVSRVMISVRAGLASTWQCLQA